MPSEEQVTSPLRPLNEAGQPIEPASSTQSPASASAGDAAGQSQAGQQSTDDQDAVSPGLNTAASQQDVGSPLRRQHRDERLEPDYFPAKILFLDGTLKGLELDLGLAFNELSESQSANFESPTEEGIRTGTNFKQVSPRGFSFKLEFFDITSDIQHLTENAFHLQEIDPLTAQPPQLMLILGDLTIAPMRCTNLRKNLTEPHANQKGFRYGTIEIELEMAGGRDSEHALAKPLTSTPLGDIRASQTEAERQRQGEQAVAKLVFEDCLGEQGSEQITQLLDSDRMQDVAAIADLEPNSFVQAAIAGFFNSETLSNEAVQQKLVSDLALTMARNENGVEERYQEAFANALLTGNLSGLPADLQEQVVLTQPDYQGILEAVATQDYAPILDETSTAGDRMRRFGSCGLTMRRVSGGALQGQQGSEAAVLTAINEFLGGRIVDGKPTGQPSEEQIRERFGDLPPEQLKALDNGRPYQSRAEFVQHLSQGGFGSITGYTLWSKFAAGVQPAEPQPELPTEEEEAIESAT